MNSAHFSAVAVGHVSSVEESTVDHNVTRGRRGLNGQGRPDAPARYLWSQRTGLKLTEPHMLDARDAPWHEDLVVTPGGTVELDESVMRRSNALREMMGFARAIIADGYVSESEAKGFQAWIEANEDVVGIGR
jgi:hypothetical protein